MQAVTERVVLGLARRAADSTSLDALCLAGGVAMNCTANGRLLREGPFDDVWIQPAAGDDGGAIGAALACWYQHSGAQRTPSGEDGMSGAFLGPAADADEVAAWAPEAGVSAERLETLELRRRVAAELADGAIVGWVQGRMEFGPRALGHRSILADARSSTVHQRLNLAVKGREGFRPFAPAVLADHAAEWFDLDRPSPYMLVVVPVAESRLIEVDEEPDSIEQRAKVVRSSIPACTHVDGSARVQTVTADANPEFHALLEEFDRQTGCPVLLNTSFNRAGEPIVATPDDALGSAQQMGLDLLVVDDWLFDLRSDEATSSRSESVA
jgi:carbamoyltransferase